MNEDYLKEAGYIALEAGLRKGVDTEVYLTINRQLSIEVADHLVETLKESEETGLGIRLIKDNKIGFAYTSDLSARRSWKRLMMHTKSPHIHLQINIINCPQGNMNIRLCSFMMKR
jgi:predicted Zn-dependent protease